MENKKSLSTLLFALALLLFVCATFAMFGQVVSYSGAVQPFPNMFQAAFNTVIAEGSRTPGLTAVFVFQLIIVTDVFAIIFGAVTNKFHFVLTIVLYGIACLCSFIALIISFNALNLYGSSGHLVELDYKLGPGPIAYSVLHILGLVSSVAGLVMSRLKA